jgi:Domain of unknown function (DUF4861)
MKLVRLTFLFVAVLQTSVSRAALNDPPAARAHQFHFSATNPTNIPRSKELIRVDLKTILAKYPSFNDRAFVVSCDGIEVPSQLDDGNAESRAHDILILSSFAAHERRSFSVSWWPDTVIVHHYPKLTQAVLGMKVDYKKVDGYYTGGRFADVDSTTVPQDHFAHDALYRIEGPGWESNKIVYRYYLDSRNRNDIFGKKVDGLVLQKLGVHDLVSNSMESYTKMLSWGMDIFKVGESLGIGSIAMWHDSKVVTVSDADSVKCYVAENGPILSGIYTRYLGWKVGGEKSDLYSHLTISAGSRLTKVSLDLNGKPSDLCTGLAKHEDCNLMESHPGDSGWAYIAVYGKQSLSGDNLGIAVFYRVADRVKVTEDSLSKIVVLRPLRGRLTYYFAAAWEEEPGGIKDEKEFRKYLEETVVRLDNPIEASF